MSRRSHTTELGSIAGEDLSEVGAGREGWLVDNPNILTALDTDSLALATRSIVLILHWSDGAADPYSHRRKIIPDLSPIDAEYISAIDWLVFDDYRVLAIGTSSGFLLIYSLKGDLIHRQLVNNGKIMKLRVRGSKKHVEEETTSEEVCVVMRTTIARFDGSDIQSMLKRWFQEINSNFWDGRSENSEASFGRLPYQLWNVSKYGSCADAAITGIMPPPLLEVQSSQRYYCAVTIGDDAVISAYRLSENRSRSIVGAILSKVVPATFSTISSLSKMLWRSDVSPKKKEEKPQSFAQAVPLTCLKDYPRKGEKLTLSPSGTLAAVTDSLGRILLLDTQALVVVRLWKGYRDASCLFVEMLVKNNSASTSSSNNYEYEKSDYCLCLVIHAPRKGIVEVWQMRTGPLLLTIPFPKGGKIMQPSYRFVSSSSSMVPSSPSYIPLEVFFLNGDSGQLSILNRSL